MSWLVVALVVLCIVINVDRVRLRRRLIVETLIRANRPMRVPDIARSILKYPEWTFGSLYPDLRKLEADGVVAATWTSEGREGRRVYFIPKENQ